MAWPSTRKAIGSSAVGWDHTLWPDKKFPNKQQLDAVAPKNPVLLYHVSGHVAVANSLALQVAKITKDTPNPKGGEFEKGDDGELTGMLKEGSAMSLVAQWVPDPTPAERRRGIELVLADLAKNGVTSVQDNSDWDDFLVYRDLRKTKASSPRASPNGCASARRSTNCRMSAAKAASPIRG